jgi:hypothetical protein
MKGKKTIKVETLKRSINDIILHSTDERVEMRHAAAIVLERVLHDTGNYHGFNYLTKEDMKRSNAGTSVGILTDESGKLLPDRERFIGVDVSRVFYY